MISIKFRIAALVMALVLMCSVGALGDEITFRGIPWESSMEEVERLLNMEYFFTYDENQMRRWEDIAYITNFEHYYDYSAGWYGYCFSGQMKVAGYPVSLDVYCMYTVDEDGQILRDKSESKLYAASYNFDVVDYEATYRDLKGKLTALYGECTETIETEEGIYVDGEKNGTYNSEFRISTWSGDNNTGIKLFCELSDLPNLILNHSQVLLCYGKTDVDSKLDALQNALANERLEKEQLERGSDNMEGL